MEVKSSLMHEGRVGRLVGSSFTEVDDAPIGFIPVQHYLGLTESNTIWLVKNLLPVGGSMIIHAQEKAGKSALAIQLAIALSGGSKDWVGFPVEKRGRVLYLQVDTPRATWAERFRILNAAGYNLDNDRIRIADTKSLDMASVNILMPEQKAYLRNMVEWVMEDPLPDGADYEPEPVAVVVDTLRKVQLGEENSSTEQQHMLDQLEQIVHPAALIIIAHSKKPQMNMPRDPISANRGSGAVTAAVDAIISMDGGRLKYVGRDIEQGSLLLQKKVVFSPQDLDHEHGVLLWDVGEDKPDPLVIRVLGNLALGSLREHGRELARLNGKSEDAATKQLSRFIKYHPGEIPAAKEYLRSV